MFSATQTKSEQKLGTDSIDLLQFHVWDDSWAQESEFRETVEKLKQDGVVRFFGLSLNRWQPENGIAALHTGLVDAVQVIYNIFDQAPEDKLFPVCRELNIGVIARVPLDEGSLGGKMTAETKFPPNDWRAKYFGPANLAKTMARVDELKKLLPPGMTLPEMSLRFILSNPRRQHDDHRHAEIAARKRKHRVQRRRAAGCRSAAEIESASLGSHARRSGLTEVGLCAQLGEAAGSGVADVA